MSKYVMGGWNYVETGVLRPETAVKDWEDLAFNLVMSFEFDPRKHDKKDLLDLLDICGQKGMKVIICDSRTHWNNLKRQGEEKFKKEVEQAVADFGSHRAAFGFHIGDEPDKNEMQTMIRAYKLVKAAAPELSPFVNFLPIWDEDNFADVLGVSRCEYKDLLNQVVREAGIEMLCYDYYGQCAYFERERFENLYFENLRVFGEVARENNIPFFTTLLSVGHWSLRCPSEDDIKWQISTSVAMGVTGILWFFIYERTLDGSYRLPPVDLFWERTETFFRLSRQNRTFMRFLAPKLENYTYEATYALGLPYAGLPLLEKGFGIEKVERVVNLSAPLLFVRFSENRSLKEEIAREDIRKNVREKFVLVNADREKPVRVKIVFHPESERDTVDIWLAPGQMNII